jgi:hypothetical protein
MKKKQVILILAIAMAIAFALGFWFGNNHDNHVKVYTVHEWLQPQEK